MSLDIQFVPNNFFSSKGHLIIPLHSGERPLCKLQSSWGARETESREGNIFLEVGVSKKMVSIDSSDLLNKLKLKVEEIELIRSEIDLSKRSLMLKNIVIFKNIIEKNVRGNLFSSLFSLSSYSSLRQTNPEGFFEEFQNILDSGPISFSNLTKAFEVLLEEYQLIPSENFFLLSEKLMEKIFIEEDKDVLNAWLDETVGILNVIGRERGDVAALTPIIDKIQVNRNALKVSSSSVGMASAMNRTYLRWLTTDQDVFTYLGLADWQTDGDKVEACKRLVECFKKQSTRLDLSNLHLTSLPDNLKNFISVKDLNLSSNEIQNITSLSQLKYLTTLDLSYNKMGGEDGISDFLPLKNLENLKSVKLLYMGGDLRRLIDHLRTELIHCEHIEWIDSWGRNCIFSRREGELLGPFLRRRDRVFSSLPEVRSANMSLAASGFEPSLLPDNPKDSALLESLPLALERLGIAELDIDTLVSKDPNIVSWLNRLAIQEGYKGLPVWKDLSLRPVLSGKVSEILRFAIEDEVFFKDVLTPLVSNSVIHCGDRTLYYFNEIVRRMELFKAKDLPLKEALPVFRKYFPVALIKAISKQSVEERALELNAEERESLKKEELEVELGFLIRFKDDFQVPLAFSKGYYTNTWAETRSSFLYNATLRMRASLKSSQEWIQYLASDPEWRRYLLQHSSSLESELQAHEQTINLSIDELEDQKSQITDFEYSKRYFELMQKNQVQTRGVLAKATEKFLKIQI